MRFFGLDLSMRHPRSLPHWLLAGGLALAACGGVQGAQNGEGGSAPQVVRQLDALEFHGAADSKLVQIRTLSQGDEQRVPPHLIVLPALTGVKAAPLPAAGLGQPQQIGVARALPDAADAAATAGLLSWMPAEGGGLRAAISVQAPGAQGLRLGLRVDQLPPAALLRVYAPDSAQTTEIAATEVLRTIQVNLAAGATGADAYTYWLPVVQGPQATLEIQLPAGIDPARLKVSIPQVSHFKMLPTDDPAQLKSFTGSPAGLCNIDVMCTVGNSATMHAVAVMVFNVGANGYVCTGTLLNNTKQDYTPYFLSANHCISTQASASSLVTVWNYRSASCNSSQKDSSYQEVNGGAQLLYATVNTDTSFMRLNSAPPANATFAGWDANTPTMNMDPNIFGIHHPKGDLQKYSQGAIAGFGVCGVPDANGNVSCFDTSLSASTFYGIFWSRGITEGGSSGSALFTSSGSRVVGQLLGGGSSCATPRNLDIYGRFDIPFNAKLSQWLSPGGGGNSVGGVGNNPPPPPTPATKDGVYRITNADGTPGDYVSVHTNGSSLTATIYRSASPSRAANFVLADGGVPVASLYKWGSWDLYNGTLTGSSATLTGYVQYGLCNASASITFGGAGGTIRVVPTGLSSFAAGGTQWLCNATGNEPALTMTRQFDIPAAHPYDGVYRITNADGTPGDYLSVHTSPIGVIATIYRSASPVRAASFALTDGGVPVATLYKWGSWDLYNGTLTGNNAALTGYAQYGLCNANVSIAFGGAGGTIRTVPTGPSSFAPAGAQPSCNATGNEPALTLVKQF